MMAFILLQLVLTQGSSTRGPAWDFTTDPIGALPTGWETRGDAPKPVYQIKADPDGNRYLSARSEGGDVQLGVAVESRPEEFQTLSWRWRVTELPKGADERHLKTLDSASSVYAVFGSRLFPRILKYVWSTSAPKGSVFEHPGSGLGIKTDSDSTRTSSQADYDDLRLERR